MENIMSICLGIGLSAACGFRIFVPLLFMSIASMSGHLTLAPGFGWVGTYPALITFSVATALEVTAYFVPWVGHFLDVIASPAAVVAGIVISASMNAGMSPMLRWTLAVIAGGSAAGLVQGTTVVARAASTLATGGLANPLVGALELGGAVLTSLLALAVPVLAVAAVLGFLGFMGWRILRRNRTISAPPVLTV